MGGTRGQFLPVECLDDLGGQQCLRLFEIRVLAAEIVEYVSATANLLQFFHLSSECLLQSLQAILHQVDLVFRRLRALLRFLSRTRG